MKRLLAIGLFALGFAVAGVFSGAVIADVTTSTSSTTTPATTTTPTTTVATTTVATTTAATTTAATTTAATTTTATPPALPDAIPPRVRVAGVRIGGLRPSDARAAVQFAFRRPLAVVVDRNRLRLDPTKVAAAYAATAVARARASKPGTNVQLVVAVRGAPLRAWVATIARRFGRPAIDATLVFRNARPVIKDDRVGRELDPARLTVRIVSALHANSRLPVRVRMRPVAPQVTSGSFAESIVISRSINRLSLYDGTKLARSFAVATGQSIYPTPRGRWHIVVKWKNPWWYPPVQDSWAKGLKPVPPGPSNPLGTRWMGLDAPGVGIHGTDEPGSIGYSVSHGCIRMQVPDAEWLFEHVGVGTTVYIV
ncbi:MAG: L,D-transpeptidase/peptidoglycan binding protein [Actinomycetota bacterium]|nr:L,D-transpeptidase/peptidoglycan binding protein [Actinomycetota bacterium]